MLSIFKNDSREFILEEKDVTTVLEVINSNYKTAPRLSVGNCGWADDPTKWFIIFNANDKIYGKVVKSLKEIGELKLDVRPGGQVDVCFERAH